MPRTKGNKNRPKTNITKDYASRIVEKQEAIAFLNTEIASIQKAIEEHTEREEDRSRGCAEEAAGQRHECGRDPRKTEIRSAVWTN